MIPLSGTTENFEDTGDLTKLLYGLATKALQQGHGPALVRKIHDDQADIVKPLLPVLSKILGTESVLMVDLHRMLLENYLCYVEFPRYQYKDGVKIRRMQKYLLTTNPNIAEEFMGYMDEKWISHLEVPETEEFEVNYLRFEVTRDGTPKVVKPRTKLSLADKDFRILPWPVLRAEIDYIVKTSRDTPLRVMFEKDDGTERTLDTSLNDELLKEVYGIDYNTHRLCEEGAYTNVTRGYIRMPELGSSKYDETMARSINLARVIKTSTSFLIDLRFTEVDLGGVTSEFEGFCLENREHKNWSMDVYLRMKEAQILKPLASAPSSLDLINMVDQMSAVLSTTFNRQLAGFMLDNQDLFPGYDGSPRDRFTGSTFGDSDIDESSLGTMDPGVFTLNF